MKKFSIITPCYRQADTLPRLIKSVEDQNYPNKEHIVILDGKDSKAEEILKMHPEVKWACTGDRNKGAPVARNMGAALATGDYYAFLDSDMFIYPGTLRTWAEIFEEKKDVDFIYSGYKFTEGYTYYSEEFDPYFLKIYNYIDGNFPMRKEVYQPWDESLKSLQDWDLWLRIVKAGGKGLYLKNQYFFEKKLPKPGSISYDSNNNWHDRVKTIKTKHELTQNDICLTSYAAEHHARRVAKVMNLDWVEPILLFNKSYEYKMIYLIGHFPANAVNNLLPFMDGAKNPPVMKKDIKKVIHWIGSDVLQVRTENMSFDAMKRYVESINKNFTQFCQSPQNEKELKELGLNVKFVPLPIDIVHKDIPMPETFTVAIYDHGTNDIYNEQFMYQIAEAMPDIRFISFGCESRKGRTSIKNFKYVGRLPIDEIVAKSSVLLRITKHDGYPVSPIEFLCRGRQCIVNQEVLKDKCIYISDDINLQSGYSDAKKNIIKAIRDLKKSYPGKAFFDSVYNKIKYEFHPMNLREELNKLL